MKTCNLCKTKKSLTEYLYVKNRHGKKAPHHQCNDCRKSEKRRLSGCNPKEVILNLETNSKLCSICKNWKNFSEYHKNKNNAGGVASFCKVCAKIKSDAYYISKTEDIKKKNSEYYKDNKPKVFKRANERNKIRCKTDALFLLKRRCRSRIYDALRKKGWTKKRKFSEYLGCSELEFKQHIENQFVDGMTWDHVFSGEIHIDHHYPLSLAKTEEDVYRLCHYSNLKPMWAVDNIRKSNKLPK